MKDYCKGCGWSQTKEKFPFCIDMNNSSTTSCDRYYEFPRKEEIDDVKVPKCDCDIGVIVNTGCPSASGGMCPSLRND